MKNKREENIIEIMGIKIPVSKKILSTNKSEIVLTYIKAMRDGRGQAKKVLKYL